MCVKICGAFVCTIHCRDRVYSSHSLRKRSCANPIERGVGGRVLMNSDPHLSCTCHFTVNCRCSSLDTCTLPLEFLTIPFSSSQRDCDDSLQLFPLHFLYLLFHMHFSFVEIYKFFFKITDQ